MQRTHAIYLTSIVSGFCMMALEIIGARLLYPNFGSSVDVWAAIISVFILSLSLGYWGGGMLADRSRNNLPLGAVLLAAGVCYLLLPIIARPLGNVIEEAMSGTRFASLPAALFLFLLPSLLLGSVSPMLIRLAFVDPDRVARTAGTLYAVGCLGNVLGVLMANYLLLVLFNDTTNVLILGVALVLVGLAHLAKRIQVAAVAGREASA